LDINTSVPNSRKNSARLMHTIFVQSPGTTPSITKLRKKDMNWNIGLSPINGIAASGSISIGQKIGVRKLSAVRNMPYKYFMSLKNTATHDSSMDTPRVNTKRYMIGMGIRISVQFTGALVTAIITARAISENAKFTSDEKTLVIGNIYLGTYTLVITALFPGIDSIATLVASLKKLNISEPVNKYTGKFSTSKRQTCWKTSVMISMFIIGLISDHNTPRTLRLYLDL